MDDHGSMTPDETGGSGSTADAGGGTSGGPPDAGAPSPTPPPETGPTAPEPTGSLPSAPSAGDAWGAPAGPVGGPMEMGQPAPKNNTGLFVGIGVLALVVIGAVLFFALKKSGGGDFPESLGGIPRSHSAQTQQIESELKKINFQGMTIDVAVYGSDIAPSHIAMIFNNVPASLKGQSLTPFLDQVASGFTGTSGGTVDTSQAVSESRDGVEYLCVPISQSGQSGAFCVFNGDKLGAVVTLSTTDPHAALNLAHEVSDAVQ